MNQFDVTVTMCTEFKFDLEIKFHPYGAFFAVQPTDLHKQSELHEAQICRAIIFIRFVLAMAISAQEAVERIQGFVGFEIEYAILKQIERKQRMFPAFNGFNHQTLEPAA